MIDLITLKNIMKEIRDNNDLEDLGDLGDFDLLDDSLFNLILIISISYLF